MALRLALLVVLAGAAMELLYLKSPNAVRYTLLTGTCLLLAGNLGHGLVVEHGLNTAYTWAQCLLVLITTDIYWNSAWQKLRSPQFRSGLYLAQRVHTYSQVRDRLPYWRQFAVPGFVRRLAGNLTVTSPSPDSPRHLQRLRRRLTVPGPGPARPGGQRVTRPGHTVRPWPGQYAGARTSWA